MPFSDDSDDREPVRRTAFAKDSREFFTKLVVGLLVGLGIWGGVYIWTHANLTFIISALIGEFLVFKFAGAISGSSRHAD